MSQYGILVYSPAPADPMALSPEYLELLESYPAEAKKLGGKVLGGSYFAGQRGFAFGPITTATAIHGGTIRSGPLAEADLVVAAFYIVSAPSLDVALHVAKLHPATRDGGVEVRPMFDGANPEARP